jgi:glycerophosphoryl diester phosphodiesterase
MKTRFFDVPPPRVFAHRGDSIHWPENTLEAFISARKHTRYFELDVWLSKDAVVMVHHDESLLRTCGVDLPIFTLSCSEIQELDAGSWFFGREASSASRRDLPRPPSAMPLRVPTLAEVFRAVPDAYITVELKHDTPDIGPALRRVVEQEGASERVLFAGEPDTLMRHAWKHLPEYPSSMPYTEIRQFIDWVSSGAKGSLSLRGRAMQVPLIHEGFNLATVPVIEAAHRLGHEVQFWTVDDPALMKSLFAMGADVVMTNDPETGAKAIR